MTKFKLFLLLALFSFTTLVVEAQLAYNINWRAPKKELIGSTERFVINFEGATYEDDLGIPYYTIYLPHTDLSAVKIINAKYEPLNDFERKLIQNNIDYSSLKVSSITAVDNFTKSTFVKILPLKTNENGELEKLVSFNLDVSHNEPSKTKRAAKVQGKTSSPLAEGKWYKIQLTEDGIYKIDKRFLESIGINTNSIDPRNIRIFGNGGGMLPQLNKTPRYDGLQENAIMVIGENDGVFNNEDYILFYGKSQNVISYDSNTNKLKHTKNIYSDASYYFINISTAKGKRIENVNSNETPEITFDYFDDLLFHENNNENFISSGKEWLGEKLTNTNRSYSFNFDLTSVYPNSTVEVTSLLYNTNQQENKVQISLNNVEKQTLNITNVTKGRDYGPLAIPGKSTVTSNASSSLSVKYTLTSSGKELLVYHDKTRVHFKRLLQPYKSQVFFQTLESLNHSSVGYQITNASSNHSVFDITEPTDVKNINYSLSGNTITFNNTSSNLSRFVLFDRSGSFLTPTFLEETRNQNLHSDVNSVPTLLIIAPPFLEEKAKEYAQMKSETVNIEAIVRTTNNIYNEFSSGAQDISALRDYIRMLYLANPDKFKYVLLFGDASYDYKNRTPNNTNYVPNYQAEESFDNVKTYSSDDFYGFMDDNEGEWGYTILNSLNKPVYVYDLLDIGIGRFPINSIEEADAIINKVRLYTTSKESFGKWRNQLVFFADDDDNAQHMEQADDLTDIIKTKYPIYNTNKIYLDAFEQVSTPSGQTSPSCINKLQQKIDKGALIVNYTGHGNETQWTEEGIFNSTDIKRLKNINKLPLFMTATCEFGKYDNPILKSAAEELLFNPNGGGIALLTTTRPVYSSSNLKVNKALYNAVFLDQRPLGSVMKDTKNNSIDGVNNRNFTLLGDPSMTLAYPKQTIIIDTIVSENDTAYFQGDTLWQVDNKSLSSGDSINFAIKALSLVTLKGGVNNNDNFSGIVELIVYDKESKIKTLGDEGRSFTFFSRENILYEGKATVKNGRFSTSFIVPKDISYQFGFGKISLYAKDSNNLLLDASGGEQNIKIGGTASTIKIDDDAPEINLYMDDFSFQNGDIVSSSPILLAELYDRSGINISTAGLGHEIVAILDNDAANALILNDFYTSNLDDYKNGLVRFPFKDLDEGEHTLTLRVWDTHNNVNEASIKFVVDYNVATVYTYPNPMTNIANFVIEHSREGIEVDVIIDIINPSGKNAYHFEKKIQNSDLIIDGISWNGENDYNAKLSPGIYFCRVTLRYADGSTVLAKVHRLVLID